MGHLKVFLKDLLVKTQMHLTKARNDMPSVNELNEYYWMLDICVNLIKQSYKLPEVDWNWHSKEKGKTY